MDVNIFPPYNTLADWLSKVNEHIGFEKSGENDRILYVPRELGEGKIWYRDILNGMSVLIVEDLAVKEEITINYNPEPALANPYYALVCSNGFSGSARLNAPAKGSETHFHQGAYLISSAIQEIHNYSPGGKSNFICVVVFPEFIETYLEKLFKKKNLYTTGADEIEEVLLQIPSLTPDIQMVVNALRFNSFSDELRTLYLESKVFELFTLFFLQFETRKQKKTALRKREKQQVYEARRIVTENLNTPPSITALSRQVGLNEYKLRQGFKELFNNTVYGYVKQQRMLKAKSLLETEELSVSEAGISVGYTNLSHFAEAFKKEFGINPSQLNRGDT